MKFRYKYPFNSERYLELVNKDKLKHNSLLDSETVELICYTEQLNDYVSWKKQSRASSLIEAFINYKIDADEFHDQFISLSKDDPKLKELFYNPSLEILKDVRIDHEYDSDFSTLFSNIDLGCELFDRQFEEENFTEEIFRTYVKQEYELFVKSDSSIDIKSETESDIVIKNVQSRIPINTSNQIAQRSYKLLGISILVVLTSFISYSDFF